MSVISFRLSTDNARPPKSSPYNKIFSCSFSLVCQCSGYKAFRYSRVCTIFAFDLKILFEFESVSVPFFPVFYIFFFLYLFDFACLLFILVNFSLFMFDGITYRRLRLGQTNLSGFGAEMSAWQERNLRWSEQSIHLWVYLINLMPSKLCIRCDWLCQEILKIKQ